MTDTPKIVVSTSLREPNWGPTTVISRDVARLKDQPGKDISVGASGTLVRFMLQERLLDELRVLVHPIVVGRGRRLLVDGGRQVSLHLIDSKTFTTGVVSLRYVPTTPGV